MRVKLYVKHFEETDDEQPVDVLFCQSDGGRATDLGIVPPSDIGNREDVVEKMIVDNMSMMIETLLDE